MKLIAFCEAPSDFRLVSGLVDRVLREVGPTWVVDNLDAPGVVLRWHADGLGNDFIKTTTSTNTAISCASAVCGCGKCVGTSMVAPVSLEARWRARRSISSRR